MIDVVIARWFVSFIRFEEGEGEGEMERERKVLGPDLAWLGGLRAFPLFFFVTLAWYCTVLLACTEYGTGLYLFALLD